MNVDESRQSGRKAKQPHCILVVDDDPVNRQLNIKMLIDAGYHVGGAQDGADGWKAIQQNNYDLIITDNKMPRMTGIEMIEKVRAGGMVLPILMATGALPKEKFTRYPWLQPTATLLKPYTLTDFLEIVKKVLTSPLDADGSSFEHNNCQASKS